MGYGIIEPRHSGHVPGTVRLFEDNSSSVVAIPVGSRRLKRGKGKQSDIVLVPQPSDSPNDPLNWPLWKRDLTLFTLCVATAVAGVVGPAIATIGGVLVKEFHTTFHMVATWSGYQFWPAGVGGLVCSAVSRVWGKRTVYLMSLILILAGAIWNACARTPNSFLGSRILQGFGLGAFETIVPSSIGDLFYVHERGKRIALYNLSFVGCSYFMPIIGGYISMKHGWRMQFIIISIFLAPILAMMFFLVPEHAYNRPAIFDTDLETLSSQESLTEPQAGSTAQASGDAEKRGQDPEAVSVVTEQKKTFVQQLSLYNGRFSDESIWKMLLAPFVLFLYPATIWTFLFQGTFITWGIGISIILAQLLSGPPTSFDPAQLGYIYTAPFIGALLSYFIGGLFSDKIAKFMARRNNNVYEPEFRILLVIPTMLAAIPGLFAFGDSAQRHLHWIVLSVCYGLITFGVVMSCTATFSYVLDAHRDVSVEMMVSILVVKNFFCFGTTFFISDWLAEVGPREMFYTTGGIQLGMCLLSGVMYMCGKLQRDFMHRHNLLKMAGLYPKRPTTAVL